jgi:hypothetical protein
LPGGSSRSSARSATSGLHRASYPLAFGAPPEPLPRPDRLAPVSSRGIRRNARSRERSPSAPSTDMLLRVHSRTVSPPCFGPEMPISGSRSALVVSHHLDGFLRAGVAGLLHPAASSWGSPRFWRCDRPALPKQAWSIVAFPRDATYPSKNSPRLQHRTTSPWPLPPRRSAPLGAVDLEAFLRCRVRNATPPLPASRVLSFHGLFPPPRSSSPRSEDTEVSSEALPRFEPLESVRSWSS